MKQHKIGLGIAFAVVLGIAAPSFAQQAVWEIWNYQAACHFGSTQHCCSPVGYPAHDPGGWPGTVWFGFDCENAATPQQYGYVKCDSAPPGAGLVCRLYLLVHQQCTFDLTLSPTSNNAFTRVTASLRYMNGPVLYEATAEPDTVPPPLQMALSLDSGLYELRVESPSIEGGPRSGLGIARVDFVSTDGDGDGVPDHQDGCPLDPLKSEPGVCGCGIADVDTDGDGSADCDDGCPADPNKTQPGQCGCGAIDTDADGDGAADCIDGCPSDSNKTAPGQCGCGSVDTDVDGDWFADCIDNCPAIANSDQSDCNHDGAGDVCEIASGASDLDSNGVPDACECLSDIDENGVTDAIDLAVILGRWGTNPKDYPRADANDDGTVDANDLAIVLSGWGNCP